MKANRNILWNRAWHQMLSVATALAIVLAGVAISAGPAAAAPPTPTPAQGGWPQEGLKVHGDWTIEVRNPDGTLVERRQFKNALVPDGAVVAAAVLGKLASPSFWHITLSSSPPGADTGPTLT